jgi:hypothetical protein
MKDEGRSRKEEGGDDFFYLNPLFPESFSSEIFVIGEGK